MMAASPNDKEEQTEAAAALAHAFAIEPAGIDLEAVRRFLLVKIGALLERNPARLMSILYRIDVAERDVKRVLAEAAPGAVPEQLADLVIARQLQKVRTRRFYREQDGDM